MSISYSMRHNDGAGGKGGAGFIANDVLKTKKGCRVLKLMNCRLLQNLFSCRVAAHLCR